MDGGDGLSPVPSLSASPGVALQDAVVKSVKDCTLQGREEEAWPGQTAVPISLSFPNHTSAFLRLYTSNFPP